MRIDNSDVVRLGNGSPIIDAYYNGARVYAYDVDAKTYFTSVIAAGGVIEPATRFAIVDMIRALKTKSCWNSILDFGLFCGVDYKGAQIKIKGSGAVTPSYWMSAADYSSTGTSAGFTGDGGVSGGYKYLNTNFNLTTRSRTSLGIFCYFNGAEQTGATRFLIGAMESTTSPQNLSGLGLMRSGTVDVGGIGSAFTSQTVPNGTGATIYDKGFVGVVTNGSNTHTYYKNGAQIGATNLPTGTIVNGSLYVLAANVTGTGFANYITTRTVRAYIITGGMTSTQVSDLSTIINTYMGKFQAAVY